jgi:ankyrin repeat protein
MPLYAAAGKGKHQVVKCLMDGASQGRVEEVERLLKGGANIEATNNDDWRPLHIAAYHGQKEVVAILLEYHASVKARIKGNYEPLHKAAQQGHFDIMELLKGAGADLESTTTKPRYTPLFLAAQEGYLEAVQYLIEQSVNVETRSKSGETPLYAAARKGSHQVVECLINSGAASGIEAKADNDWTPLHIAVYEGNEGVVALLVGNKQNLETKVPKDGYRPLHRAAEKSNVKIVQTLINAGAELNSTTDLNTRQTPLYLAAKCKQLEVVLELLSSGAKINHQSFVGEQEGWTPLHVAVIVTLLLSNGADRMIKDNQNKTALSLAEDRNYREVIDLFSATREVPSTSPSGGLMGVE